MTPYAQSLLDSMFGMGCRGDLALKEIRAGNDEVMVCHCGEPLEFGHNSIPTAICQNRHIWYQVEGEWKLINLWRM